MSTYILRSIRSFCHVRNTRKDNYPICTKHAFSSCKVNHSYLFHIYLFICSLSYIRYIFLFFLLSFTLDSYTTSLFLSFSLPHFHSFLFSLLLTFTHLMLRKQIIYNLTYHICANGRKRSLRIMCLLHT